MGVVRWQRTMAFHLVRARLLAYSGAFLALAPAVAEARKPLPYVEIVQPPRRMRLLDVRWSVQTGGGFSLGERAPVLALAQTAHVSFIELSKTTHFHVAFGTSGFVDLTRGWEKRRGMFGPDVGIGLSRHVPGGPAMVATVTAGPRWIGGTRREPGDPQMLDRREQWRVDGWGVVGQIDAYPFYATIPEIAKSEPKSKHGWFRRFVLSGLHVWVAARYDMLRGRTGAPTFLAGAGFDVGRTLLLPLMTSKRRY